jgi:DNA-binding NarL/FixJ family response regulator
MPTRAVLADDHVLVRQSLRSFLEREGIQVADEASDLAELNLRLFRYRCSEDPEGLRYRAR